MVENIRVQDLSASGYTYQLRQLSEGSDILAVYVDKDGVETHLGFYDPNDGEFNRYDFEFARGISEISMEDFVKVMGAFIRAYISTKTVHAFLKIPAKAKKE